ncbi:MAG: ribosome hibernation-promoting factor, HPF/YfiA family [Candidatus Bruticola sp.]
MQITVSGKNFEVSSSLREHVVEKLEKKIGRFDTVVTANVTMSTDRHRRIVEITLFGKGFEMRAEERDYDDMYRSVNCVVEKLEKQLDKARSKNLDVSRKDREEIKEAAPEAEDERGGHKSPVSHTVSYTAEPMSVEAAISAMGSKGYSFYAFHNIDNGRINVVYIADDGGYGLIDPKM